MVARMKDDPLRIQRVIDIEVRFEITIHGIRHDRRVLRDIHSR